MVSEQNDKLALKQATQKSIELIREYTSRGAAPLPCAPDNHSYQFIGTDRLPYQGSSIVDHRTFEAAVCKDCGHVDYRRI